MMLFPDSFVLRPPGLVTHVVQVAGLPFLEFLFGDVGVTTEHETDGTFLLQFISSAQ